MTEKTILIKDKVLNITIGTLIGIIIAISSYSFRIGEEKTKLQNLISQNTKSIEMVEKKLDQKADKEINNLIIGQIQKDIADIKTTLKLMLTEINEYNKHKYK